MKFPVWRQLLIAIGIATITTLAILIWIIMNFGFSSAEYSILSIADIEGGTIAGMIRILFIMKVFGIFRLESLFVFLNRYFYNKSFRVASIVAGLSILPIWIVYIWEKTVIIGSFGNFIMGINAIRYSFEYVGVLCLLAVVVFAFCKYMPVYHYSDEEIEKMKKHFHGV